MKLLVVRHAIAEDREDYQERAQREAQKREAQKSKGRRVRKSGDQSHPVNDDFRPLTSEGLRKMKKIAKSLPEFIERPVILLSSPLVRAIETAEVLRGAWRDKKNGRKLDVQVVEWLRPDSSPDELVESLADGAVDIRDDSLVAIIGHEPHLSQLVSWLISGSRNSHITLKKGGACLIEFDGRPARGEGCLQWLAVPSMLRS